jgi:hypothetical protein
MYHDDRRQRLSDRRLSRRLSDRWLSRRLSDWLLSRRLSERQLGQWPDNGCTAGHDLHARPSRRPYRVHVSREFLLGACTLDSK